MLEEMHGLGLRATELGPPGYLPTEARALRELLAAHELGLAAGFLAVVLHKPELREGSLSAVRAAAAALAGAGGEVLVLAAANERADYDRHQHLDPAGWRALADALAEAGQVTEDIGLALAVHPHAGTLIERWPEVSHLLEATGAELCLDTGHLIVAGMDPIEVAGAAAGRVRHVHLKDVDGVLAAAVRTGGLGFTEAVGRGLFRPLGVGVAELAALVRRLEADGYRGWYVLEQDVMLTAEPGTGQGPVGAARESLRWFQQLVDRPGSRATTQSM
jgi:inosose dehydratase